MSVHRSVFLTTAAAVIVGCLLSGLISWHFMGLPYQDAFHARTEFGIIELVTSYVWLIPIGFGIGLGITRRELCPLLIALVCFLLLCRELDLHKLYTLESVSSTRYWRSPEVPFLQKLPIGLALLGAAFAGYRLFRLGFGSVLKAAREGEIWVGAFFGGIVMAGIPVILDNVLDMDDLENRRVLFGSLLEEAAEMLVPGFLGLAFLLWARGGKTKQEAG